MPITRLNHAVLFVRDAQRSAQFYADVLGFRRVDMGGEAVPGAVFMQAPGSTNDHDLGLFSVGDGVAASEAGKRTVGLYHLAWEVDTLEDLERLSAALSAVGALAGATDHSTTKSLYGRDPDGLEFEIAWVVPADLLDDDARSGRSKLRPLDLGREIDRYGAATPGGIGISR